MSFIHIMIIQSAYAMLCQDYVKIKIVMNNFRYIMHLLTIQYVLCVCVESYQEPLCITLQMSFIHIVIIQSAYAMLSQDYVKIKIVINNFRYIMHLLTIQYVLCVCVEIFFDLFSFFCQGFF